MTKEELREKIAQELYEEEFSRGYWEERMSKGDKVKWLYRANQILSLIKEAGYKSPQEINQWLEEQKAEHRITEEHNYYETIIEPLRLEIRE